MNDDREVARLWRINRTIHELVADRVCNDEVPLCCLLYTSPSPRDRTRSTIHELVADRVCNDEVPLCE